MLRNPLFEDCLLPPIFRKIIVIEDFVLRAAILDECKIDLAGGGRFGKKRG